MQVCSLRLSHSACPHVCLLIRCRYDARQWNSHESHVWNVVISVGGIFLYNALYVAWQTKKNWAFSVLLAAISAALHESFVRRKYSYGVSRFYYIEYELFAVFIKVSFNKWRRFFRPSVPVKCPRGRGIWSPEWILVWGIQTAFWLGEGGIWTIVFKKVKCPGGGGDIRFRKGKMIDNIFTILQHKVHSFNIQDDRPSSRGFLAKPA